MPTYGYRCDKGHEFEIVQGIRDDPLTTCQVCGAPVRRIFYPVGIVFKGPGFYKTDSRGGSSSSSVPAASTSESSSSSDSGSSASASSASSSSSDKSSSDKGSTSTSDAKKSTKKSSGAAPRGGDG